MQQLPPSQQQQQQQQQSMVMPPFPPASITTEQIQKYLDENKKLILAILDNQNLGKLAECAQYQAQLQKNLMYLAAIADAQPQAPAMPSQVPTHPGMQQGGHYMQHPHAGAMGQQQPSGFPAKMPMQFNAQHMQEQQQRLQQLHQQHQQQAALHSPFGLNPGVGNGMQGMHNEVNPGGSTSGGLSSTSGIADFSRAGANGGGAGVAGAAPDGASGGGAAAGVTTPAGAIGGVNSGAAGGGVSGSSMDMRGSKQDGVESGSGDPQGKAGNSNANGEQSHATGSEDA